MDLGKQKYSYVDFAFLSSGAAGLLYQISWQRLLFMTFGIDLISVTIIISVFMLGLGTGALYGGYLSDKWPTKSLQYFAFFEFLIGVYGFLSPNILRYLALSFFDLSFIQLFFINFIFLLIPTFLMGATLPVLVQYYTQYWGNVGQSTGHLYALNTFGAMLGAFITDYFLFKILTLDQVIYIAAIINFSSASIVFYSFNRKI